MAGFKLFVFDREAHFIGPQESGCSTIGRSQKAVWILAHNNLNGRDLYGEIISAHLEQRSKGREPDSFARWRISDGK